MKRTIFLAYGVASYLFFLATYLLLAAFVIGFGLPRTIDGPVTSTPMVAVGVDVLLLGLFAAQHSIMARPGFKKLWTRIVPEPIERSTYVVASCLAVLLLIWLWQPIGGYLWVATAGAATYALWTLFALGVLMVPAVTLMISHFDLFGLRQVWLHWRERTCEGLSFRTPLLYRWVRHPLYIGWFIFFWATPTMSWGHLLLAATWTIYMVLATFVEERDLIGVFGQQYAEYRRQVPRFVPRFRRRGATSSEQPQQVEPQPELVR